MNLPRYMILGFTGITAILSLEKTYSTVKKPFGFKMCDKFCSPNGCLLNYSFENLSCSATFLQLSEYARKHVIIYRSSEDKQKDKGAELTGSMKNPTNKHKSKSARLLISPYEKDPATPFLEMDLFNYSSIKSYFNLSAYHITAVAFMWRYQKLFVASKKPNHLFAYTESTRAIVSLNHDIVSYGLSVDEEKERLFLTTHKPRRGIYSMSIKGGNLSQIYTLTCPPWAISLDTKREVIFTCCKDEVFSITYSGKRYETLQKYCKTFDVALDQTVQYLYYNCKENVSRLSLVSKEIAGVWRFEGHPYTMALHKGMLYVSLLRKRPVYELNLNTSEISRIYNNTQAPKTRRLCIVYR